LPVKITEKFEEAVSYIIRLQGHQYRKGTKIPYISHLLATAATVMEYGDSEEQVIAALLHDAAEDAGGEATLIEIESKFGTEVAGIVKACSDTLEENKPEWKTRKKAYIEKLKQVNNHSVLLVSIADKLHNIQSILRDYKKTGEKLWERFNASRDETLCYYYSLLDIYKNRSKHLNSVLINELEANLEEISQLITKNNATVN